MTIERFTIEEFETALSMSVGGDDLSIEKEGWVGGELRYSYLIEEFEDGGKVKLLINSSIGPSGVSADTGQNSIRVWIADDEGNPLGNKTQNYITREPGWNRRLSSVMGEVIQRALTIEKCKKCGEIEHVYLTKKEGPNKGRFFKKCPNDCSFVWLDTYIPDSPGCPKCGSSMVLRDGKYGEFWGCSSFPKCRETMNVDEWESDEGAIPIQMALDEIRDRKTNHKSELLDFEPSEYQKDIFDWVENREPGNHLIVNALAGSGKTTTALKMLEYTEGEEVLFVAFNKAIQTELAKRAPRHVTVKTYHALGFGACRSAYDLDIDDVDSRKIYKLLPDILDKNRYKGIFSTINKLVSLVKANLEEPSDEVLWEMSNRYGVELNGDAEVIFEAVRATLNQCQTMTNTVDFDDMCWLPVIHDLPMKQYDLVIVDEAQDTNRNQIALALMSVKDNGSIIAVGDEYQAIYGFRGADTEAIPNLREELDAETLPLSITYRCPKNIVELVNQRFPDIPLECWGGNPYDGRIFRWSYSQALSSWKDGDMVLCRVNAPLVEPCFNLIRRGVKATIRGRDIGKGLITLIDKMDVEAVNPLIRKLTQYRNAEVQKLLNAEKAGAARSLEDKVDTLIALTEGVETIDNLKERIEQVFSDDEEGVIFSSVHRAKGLQSERVSILHRDLMPHPYAQQPWELEQESNIEYVAYTRTLRDLVFVS